MSSLQRPRLGAPDLHSCPLRVQHPSTYLARALLPLQPLQRRYRCLVLRQQHRLGCLRSVLGVAQRKPCPLFRRCLLLNPKQPQSRHYLMLMRLSHPSLPLLHLLLPQLVMHSAALWCQSNPRPRSCHSPCPWLPLPHPLLLLRPPSPLLSQRDSLTKLRYKLSRINTLAIKNSFRIYTMSSKAFCSRK